MYYVAYVKAIGIKSFGHLDAGLLCPAHSTHLGIWYKRICCSVAVGKRARKPESNAVLAIVDGTYTIDGCRDGSCCSSIGIAV